MAEAAEVRAPAPDGELGHARQAVQHLRAWRMRLRRQNQVGRAALAVALAAVGRGSSPSRRRDGRSLTSLDVRAILCTLRRDEVDVGRTHGVAIIVDVRWLDFLLGDHGDLAKHNGRVAVPLKRFRSEIDRDLLKESASDPF